MSTPIEGQVLLLAATKASVPGDRVPELAERVQNALGPRIEEYRRRYECIHENGDGCWFLVPGDHWGTVTADLGLERREGDAVRRAHEEQLKRLGKRLDRREEFETALEIRSCVVIAE